MGWSQALVGFLILLGGVSSRADWLATVGRAGYFGKFSLGAVYEWETQDEFEISLGQNALARASSYQVNFEYRYSRWAVPWGERTWEPMQAGAFVLYSLDKNNFLSSPKQYPYDGYYDETALRWGLGFGTAVRFKDDRYELAYRVRILDSGVIATYNNVHRDLQYYVSSALNVLYRF